MKLILLLICTVNYLNYSQEKIIIGIHGIANKPEKSLLEMEWKKAINEGLNHNEGFQGNFNFEVVHWADYLYKSPNHFDTTMCYDNSFNPEVYIPADEGELEELFIHVNDEMSWMEKRKTNARSLTYDTRDIAVDAFGSGRDALINFYRSIIDEDEPEKRSFISFLEDVEYYFNKEQMITNIKDESDTARIILKNELKETLLKHNGKKIMLIAHSLGSVIAYEVLCEINDIEIEHFVTIGSPLGLSYVQEKLSGGLNISSDSLLVPECINKWTNYSEWKDAVCLDLYLSGEFIPNSMGVEIIDDPVNNNYKFWKYDKTNCKREKKLLLTGINPMDIYELLKYQEQLKII